MKSKSLVLSGILLPLSVIGLCQEAAVSPPSRTILERPVEVSSSPTFTSIAFQNVVLASGIPGGEVIMQRCTPSQAVVRLSGNTLGEALDSITVADPHYRWTVEGGVVDLLPASGVPALLKVRIDAFDSGKAADISSAGASLFSLPETLRAATRLGLAQSGSGSALSGIPAGPLPPKKPLGVHLESVTVQDALNATVRANRHGIWIYRETHCGTTQLFDVSFTQ